LHERRPAANAAAVTTLKISTGNWFHMLTVICPLANSYLQSATASAGAVAELAATREIQHTGRPVHLPAHCCGVTWSNELGGPQVPGRPRSEDFARLETTGKLRFCFNAFLFCYFVSILFCCTIVLSWMTARNISLSILSQLFQFFSYPRFSRV